MATNTNGQHCSFSELCGRGCTPAERERCFWWLPEHNKKLEQPPLILLEPLLPKDPCGQA